MYIYMYIYIYLHVYTYMYIHAYLHVYMYMMMIAFITIKSSLVPLIEGLCAIHEYIYTHICVYI